MVCLKVVQEIKQIERDGLIDAAQPLESMAATKINSKGKENDYQFWWRHFEVSFARLTVIMMPRANPQPNLTKSQQLGNTCQPNIRLHFT